MAKHEEKKFAEGVKKMTGDELGIELKSRRDKLYTLRSQAVTEKVENVAQFGFTRRAIARLLTEQSARRLNIGQARTPAKAPVKKVGKPASGAAGKPAAKHVPKAAKKFVTAAGKMANKPGAKRAKTAPKRKAKSAS